MVCVIGCHGYNRTYISAVSVTNLEYFSVLILCPLDMTSSITLKRYMRLTSMPVIAPANSGSAKILRLLLPSLVQQNLPKTERDRSGIFFPFSQVSVLQRVVF